jgi:hypothetical protein
MHHFCCFGVYVSAQDGYFRIERGIGACGINTQVDHAVFLFLNSLAVAHMMLLPAIACVKLFISADRSPQQSCCSALVSFGCQSVLVSSALVFDWLMRFENKHGRGSK